VVVLGLATTMLLLAGCDETRGVAPLVLSLVEFKGAVDDVASGEGGAVLDTDELDDERLEHVCAEPLVVAAEDAQPPASVDDTTEYVRYRLAAAGTDRALFPDDALAALHEASQGALREIDRLATAALRDAAKRKKKLVDRDVVTRAAEALARFD